MRQLVTESLALAALGGVAAIAVAYALHGVLVRMLADSDPRFQISFALDPRVLAFVVVATLAARAAVRRAAGLAGDEDRHRSHAQGTDARRDRLAASDAFGPRCSSACSWRCRCRCWSAPACWRGRSTTCSARTSAYPATPAARARRPARGAARGRAPRRHQSHAAGTVSADARRARGELFAARRLQRRRVVRRRSKSRATRRSGPRPRIRAWTSSAPATSRRSASRSRSDATSSTAIATAVRGLRRQRSVRQAVLRRPQPDRHARVLG